MAASVIGNTGFELGALPSGANGVYKTVTAAAISSTTPRNGTYCARITSSAASGRLSSQDLVSVNQLVSRLAFKVISVSAGNRAWILEHLVTGGDYFGIYVDGNDGNIYCTVNGGTAIQGPAVNDGAWHYVEMQSSDSATASAFANWKVDGAAQTQATGTLAFPNASMISIACGRGVAWTGTVDYDDWIWGSWTTAATDWFGDGLAEAVVIASDGTHSFIANDFSTGDAGTVRAPSYTLFFDMVNDATAPTTRSTTDDIAQRVVRATGYVELKPAASPSGRPNANVVRAHLAFSSATGTGGGNTGGCIAINSDAVTTEIWGTPAAPQNYKTGSGSPQWFKQASITPPSTGWTKANIDALLIRCGYSTNIAGPPSWQYIILEVDWPVAAATPISGTDTNSTTTETATEVATASNTDAGTASVEIGSPRFSASATDSSGTITESTFVAVPKSATDANSTTTEIGSIAVPISGTDANGATTESGSVNTGVTPISGTDSNSATTEIAVETAVSTATDAGSGIENSVETTVASAADSNSTTTETGSVSSVTPVSGTDSSGASTETASVTITITVPDGNGATTEIIVQAANTTALDVNSATTETTALSLLVPSDSGTASETPTLVNRETATDVNGTTNENATTNTPKTDTDSSGPTTEVSTPVARGTGSDSGSSTEPGVVLARYTAIDASTGVVEAVVALATYTSQDVSGADTESTVIGRFLTGTDTGTSSEITRLSLTVVDFGSGADVELGQFILTDNEFGSSTESASVVIGLVPGNAGTARWILSAAMGIPVLVSALESNGVLLGNNEISRPIIVKVGF